MVRAGSGLLENFPLFPTVNRMNSVDTDLSIRPQFCSSFPSLHVKDHGN